MAYYFGGFDNTLSFGDNSFLYKMAYPSSHPDSLWRPRMNAGIDCSGLVTRCFGRSIKESTTTLPNYCNEESRTTASPGDILNKPSDHVVFITGFDGTYSTDIVHITAATGGQVSRVEDYDYSWSYWQGQGYSLLSYKYWSVPVPNPVTSWGIETSPLTLADAGYAQVTLEWNNAPGFNSDTKYRVFWGTSPGNYSYQSDQLSSSGYTATGLSPWTTYYFAVKVGADGYGWSNYSNELSTRPYGPISNNTTISSDMLIHGEDILIQSGATLTINPNVTLNFEHYQQGINYGGDSTLSELVIQNGGTLILGESAKLTSIGTWGGIYHYDGGDIDLGPQSVISNARIGIFLHGNAVVGCTSSSYRANIFNCTVEGIRITDCAPSLSYLNISNCTTGIGVIGTASTPIIYHCTIRGPITSKGLSSCAYSVPRSQSSAFGSGLADSTFSGDKIYIYQYGSLDIDQKNNNVFDDASSYAVYIASNCPSILTRSVYWGVNQPFVNTNLFNDIN